MKNFAQLEFILAKIKSLKTLHYKIDKAMIENRK